MAWVRASVCRRRRRAEQLPRVTVGAAPLVWETSGVQSADKLRYWIRRDSEKWQSHFQWIPTIFGFGDVPVSCLISLRVSADSPPSPVMGQPGQV
jgi:hypothetical protein